MPRSCISARSFWMFASARSRSAVLLGHAGPVLGQLGLALALGGRGAMLAGDGLAARAELALGLLAISGGPHARQQ